MQFIYSSLYIHGCGWYNGHFGNGEFNDMNEISTDWIDVISIPTMYGGCYGL